MSALTDIATVAVELVRLAADLFDGRETKEGARRRVRDILPEDGASEQAARDLAESLRLERLGEMDDPGTEP
jgi:hypothetical protein